MKTFTNKLLTLVLTLMMASTCAVPAIAAGNKKLDGNTHYPVKDASEYSQSEINRHTQEIYALEYAIYQQNPNFHKGMSAAEATKGILDEEGLLTKATSDYIDKLESYANIYDYVKYSKTHNEEFTKGKSVSQTTKDGLKEMNQLNKDSSTFIDRLVKADNNTKQ